MTENLLIPQRMLYQIPVPKKTPERHVCPRCVCVKESRRTGMEKNEQKRQHAVEEKKVIKAPGKITGHSLKTDPCDVRLCVISVPMSLHLTASGRLISVTNFAASRRISITLLSKAKAGARGKEATNKDTNPYWITVTKNIQTKVHVNPLCWRSTVLQNNDMFLTFTVH